jgi:hypothetical protein
VPPATFAILVFLVPFFGPIVLPFDGSTVFTNGPNGPDSRHLELLAGLLLRRNDHRLQLGPRTEQEQDRKARQTNAAVP